MGNPGAMVAKTGGRDRWQSHMAGIDSDAFSGEVEGAGVEMVVLMADGRGKSRRECANEAGMRL